MRVLIVESNCSLAAVWGRHLERVGLQPVCVEDESAALEVLASQRFAVVIMNLNLVFSLSVADYCNFRWPNTRVMFVTNDSFFSDGSIFSHSSNACAVLAPATQPADLAAMVNYYAMD